ncbi:MAG: hypothetical protein ACLS8R_05590 [Anaeromassilibacillus sp.]
MESARRFRPVQPGGGTVSAINEELTPAAHQRGSYDAWFIRWGNHGVRRPMDAAAYEAFCGRRGKVLTPYKND